MKILGCQKTINKITKNPKNRREDSARTSRRNSDMVARMIAGITWPENINRKALFQGLKKSSLSKYSSTF